MRGLRLARDGVIVVVLTLALAEVGVRLANPTPPMQVVRTDRPGLGMHEFAGRPYWTVSEQGTFEMPGRCEDGAPLELAFAGDSVFAAVIRGGMGSRSFEIGLADVLHEARPDTCVRPLSVSGYTAEQQLARLLEAHHDRPLDAAVVGVFKPAATWVQVGVFHINTRGAEVLDSGVPIPPLPVPEWLHREAFSVSALWRTASLVVASSRGRERVSEPSKDVWGYLEIVDWAEAEGVEVLWTFWPTTDRPFSESGLEDLHEHAWKRQLFTWLKARGARTLWIADLLEDLDVTAIRGDTCCHYLQAGHDIIAERLRPHVETLLDDVSAEDDTDP